MYTSESGSFGAWISDEVRFSGDIKEGTRGRKAERVQEWLNLHGCGLAVDGDFGPITRKQVLKFQAQSGLTQNGFVDGDTFAGLLRPMIDVLSPKIVAGEGFSDCVARLARHHLKIHPMEIGGQNSGPWVRMYMKGSQGVSWPWCAGFVSFLMNQASELLDVAMPIKGSFSCDSLASQAKSAKKFVRESNVKPNEISAGSLFLVRRSSTDWTHVGTVKNAGADDFETIEGNTNDEGSREGYEVCERARGYSKKDFIVF